MPDSFQKPNAKAHLRQWSTAELPSGGAPCSAQDMTQDTGLPPPLSMGTPVFTVGWCRLFGDLSYAQ